MPSPQPPRMVEASPPRYAMTKSIWSAAFLLVSGSLIHSQIPADGSRRKIEQDGLAISFSVGKAKSSNPPAPLKQGDAVEFRFAITDTANGKPIASGRPAAWMDMVRAGEVRSPDLCTKKLSTFLSGGLESAADIDLNAFYVVTLNADASLSVVDPLFGYGGSKLLAMVPLSAPGRDWVLGSGESDLFVSIPTKDEVAWIDTRTWTAKMSIKIKSAPGRLAIQPDGHYLWVLTPSGVAVVTAENGKTAAWIATGKSPSDIAFGQDGRFAFVSNAEAGTVSVIDTRTLKKMRDVPAGVSPVSIAFSNKAGMVYVTDSADGFVTVIDTMRHSVVAKIKTASGASRIRFARDGRWGFVTNPDRKEVYILDSASNQLMHTVDTKPAPDQVTFTDNLAYIRHRGSDQVLMVHLDAIGRRGAPVSVVDFPGGKNPPGAGAESTPADGMVQVPGEVAMLVANPRDKAVYYYKEGMAAPMGEFSNYGHQPLAVLVVDRRLRERVKPGVYETEAILGNPGLYDVVFLLDSPRLIHCFPVTVAENPEVEMNRPYRIEFLNTHRTVKIGEKFRVTFRLAKDGGAKLALGVPDLGVFMYLAPGIWSVRDRPQPTDQPGIYSVELAVPKTGVYYLHVSAPSLNLEVNGPDFLILRAVDEKSLTGAN